MTGETGDEDRLAGLFRDAASDGGAPPPGFGHGDVVATSRRITARRRSAVIGGALALFAVAGVGTVVALPRGESATVSAAAPAERAADGAADSAHGPALAAPHAAPVPGGAGAPGVVPAPAPPLGPGSTTCADRQDPALRALLVQVLPDAATARAAATTDVCLPGTERYLSLELGGGVFTVAYLPPGTIPSLVEGASSAPTASGGTVIVSPPPAYRDRAPAILQYLAPRL
jgi:hypothetical protein